MPALGLCRVCLRYVDPRARFCSTCRKRVDRERRGAFRSPKLCGTCREHGHFAPLCPKRDAFERCA